MLPLGPGSITGIFLQIQRYVSDIWSCRVKCPDQTAQMSPIRHEKGRIGRPSGTANGHGLVIDQQSCPLYRPHDRGGSCWPGR
jgi:hypothetical protein